jgi:hypothetical protein
VTNLARSLEASAAWSVDCGILAGEAEMELYEHDHSRADRADHGHLAGEHAPPDRERCDYLVKLPMAGSVSDLNVSVALFVCSKHCVDAGGSKSKSVVGAAGVSAVGLARFASDCSNNHQLTLRSGGSLECTAVMAGVFCALLFSVRQTSEIHSLPDRILAAGFNHGAFMRHYEIIFLVHRIQSRQVGGMVERYTKLIRRRRR